MTSGQMVGHAAVTKARRDDGDIGKDVIARRQERGTRQAAASGAETGEHQGAGTVDEHGAKAGDRELDRFGRHGGGELAPQRPEDGERRDQQDASQGHAETRPCTRGPVEGEEDQGVDRGIFEEIDAVGEQRDRTDMEGDCELDAEIGEVEQRDDEDGAAE